MNKLPQEVKLKILIDDLNIECTTVVMQLRNPHITIAEMKRLEGRYEEAYRESQSKVVRLEQQCNRLYKELNKADDEVLDLKLERDMYKEEHEKVRQKYIDKDVELQIVDRIVLQYEQVINELEEQLNELTPK